MDEDRLSPEFGRLIDAAKAVAAGTVATALATGGGGAGASPDDAGAPRRRAEGWAVLTSDGGVHSAADLASAARTAHTIGDASRCGGADPAGIVAAAFAVAGEPGETLLPQSGWRPGTERLDPELPVAVKYLGRWVVATLGEIPG